MGDKKIIIAFFIFFLISAFYLSLTESLQIDPNYQKNWWALSFIEPGSENFSFSIDNHSESENFRWQILDAKYVVDEGKISIDRGEIANIAVDVPIENISDKKITVLVSDGKYKKEIYKSFSK